MCTHKHTHVPSEQSSAQHQCSARTTHPLCPHSEDLTKRHEIRSPSLNFSCCLCLSPPLSVFNTRHMQHVIHAHRHTTTIACTNTHPQHTNTFPFLVSAVDKM